MFLVLETIISSVFAALNVSEYLFGLLGFNISVMNIPDGPLVENNYMNTSYAISYLLSFFAF